jgi:hypothetical protein
LVACACQGRRTTLAWLAVYLCSKVYRISSLYATLLLLEQAPGLTPGKSQEEQIERCNSTPLTSGGKPEEKGVLLSQENQRRVVLSDAQPRSESFGDLTTLMIRVVFGNLLLMTGERWMQGILCYNELIEQGGAACALGRSQIARRGVADVQFCILEKGETHATPLS